MRLKSKLFVNREIKTKWKKSFETFEAIVKMWNCEIVKLSNNLMTNNRWWKNLNDDISLIIVDVFVTFRSKKCVKNVFDDECIDFEDVNDHVLKKRSNLREKTLNKRHSCKHSKLKIFLFFIERIWNDAIFQWRHISMWNSQTWFSVDILSVFSDSKRFSTIA